MENPEELQRRSSLYMSMSVTGDGIYKGHLVEKGESGKVLELIPQIHISKSNSKLGEMLNFSLPARAVIFNGSYAGVCYGATKWCRTHCYARAGGSAWPQTQKLYAENFLMSLQHGERFRTALYTAIQEKRGIKVDREEVAKAARTDGTVESKGVSRYNLVRVHASGDYYSAAYVKDWEWVMKQLPDVHFYAYTRMWPHRISEEDVKDLGMDVSLVRSVIDSVWKELQRITGSNFELLLSTDEFTGPVPEGWREAGISLVTRYGDMIIPEGVDALTYQKKVEAEHGRQLLFCPNIFTHQALKKDAKAHGMSLEKYLKAIANGEIKVEKGHVNHLITCNECGICWNRNNQFSKTDVVFSVHGSGLSED